MPAGKSYTDLYWAFFVMRGEVFAQSLFLNSLFNGYSVRRCRLFLPAKRGLIFLSSLEPPSFFKKIAR
jgi:hypothetical protein